MTSTLVIHAYNRPEMLRASIVSVLAFANGDVNRIVVQDDCSSDWRTRLWLRSLAKRGLLELMESPARVSIGDMYKWTAETCTDNDYVLVLDGDAVLAPDAVRTMLDIWQHWTEADVRLGMLCASTGRGHDEPKEEDLLRDGPEWVLWGGRHGDLLLVMFPSELMFRLRDKFVPNWKHPCVEYTLQLRKEKYSRRVPIKPRILTVHLGKMDSDLPTNNTSRYRSTWGGLGVANPFPDLFDEKEFLKDTMAGSMKFGTALSEKYLNQSEQCAIAAADKEAGLES